MKIIVGSSWAIGTFERGGKLSGPGIAQYLNLCGPVVNLSAGATDNNNHLRVLAKFLNNYHYRGTVSQPTEDTYYWIVHSPMYNKETEESRVLICTKDTINLHDAVLSRLQSILARANDIAKRNNIIINLIGGLCDLDNVDTTPYTSLNPIVPSWGKLCDNSYASSIFSIRGIDDFEKQVLENKPELITQLHEIQAISFKKRRSMIILKEWFDANHPTQAAHIKLRDFLYPDQSHLL